MGAGAPPQKQNYPPSLRLQRWSIMVMSGRETASRHVKAPVDWDSTGAFLLVRCLFGYSSPS